MNYKELPENTTKKPSNMKKLLIPIIIIGVIAFALYSWGKNFNNTAVDLQESATKAWGNVESSYQRRSDLIGSLVKTVQGAADFEKGTLIEVIEARSKATSINIDPSNITPEQLAQFNQAQSGLSGALSRLLVTVERYPDIKANQNFLELQSQLEGTENRINVARDRFNEAIEPYNKHIKRFPNSILAGIFNFDAMNYYKADAGSENAPDIDFDFSKKE